MSAALRVRILTGIFAEVEAPRDATAVEIVGALCAGLQLGDGPYHLEERGRALAPLEPLTPGGPVDLEPRTLAESLAKQMICVGDWTRVGDIRIRTVDQAGKPVHDRLSGSRPADRSDPIETDPSSAPADSGAPFCTNCGASLGTGDACDGCGCPASGSVAVEKVEHPEGRPFALPPVCCCCLRPQEESQKHKVLYKQQGNVKTYLYVDMSWCRECKRRNSSYRFVGGMIAAASIAGGIGGGYIANEHGAGGWVVFFAGVAAFIALMTTLRLLERLPFFNQRGHVRGCDAFPGVAPAPSGSAAQFLFRNRKFAKVWRSLNG